MKKHKTGNLRIVSAFLILALVSGGWWIFDHNKNSQPVPPPTASVVRRDFSSSVLATGAIKSQIGSEVKVGARVSGKVIRLYANIGDTVKRGQIIAELEKEDLKARVEKNRADLAVAEARVVEFPEPYLYTLN